MYLIIFRDTVVSANTSISISISTSTSTSTSAILSISTIKSIILIESTNYYQIVIRVGEC